MFFWRKKPAEPVAAPNDAPLELPLGGLFVSPSDWAPNFLTIGEVGSGKTLTMRLLLAAFVRMWRAGMRVRFVIADPKREELRLLSSLGMAERVFLINPYDARGSRWDMARDLSVADAAELSTLLVPDDRLDHSPFFNRTARQLLTEAISTLMRESGGQWDLADVVHAGTPENLSKVLAKTERGRMLAEAHLGAPQGTTGANVESTLVSKLENFEHLARPWRRAERSVSLNDWFENGGALVLAAHPKYPKVCETCHTLVFDRVAQILLAQPEMRELDQGRTVVFLDEAREMQLRGLRKLTNHGRSKGVSTCIGTQSVEGWEAAYGDEAHEILATCGNQAFLRMSGVKSRKHASEFFGTYETTQTSISGGSSSNGSNSGWNESPAMRQAFLEQEWGNLPPASLEEGYHGVFAIPGLAWRGHVSPAFLKAYLPMPDPAVPGLVPCPSPNIEEPVPLAESVVARIIGQRPPGPPPSKKLWWPSE